MNLIEELLAVFKKHNAYIRSDCQTGCDLVIVVDGKEIGTLEHTDWAKGPVVPYFRGGESN